MRPVVGVRRFAERQTDDIPVRTNVRPKHRPVGVAEIRRYLVNLEDLTIVETRLPIRSSRSYRSRSQASDLGIVHRPAPERGEAVSINIDNIDIACALGDALLDDLAPFPNERRKQAIYNLFV